MDGNDSNNHRQQKTSTSPPTTMPQSNSAPSKQATLHMRHSGAVFYLPAPKFHMTSRRRRSITHACVLADTIHANDSNSSLHCLVMGYCRCINDGVISVEISLPDDKRDYHHASADVSLTDDKRDHESLAHGLVKRYHQIIISTETSRHH